MDYKSYIVSSEWRSKHKGFLKRSHYRCSFFPFIKCGKKGRYNVHHMNYEKQSSEHLRVDVIVVCPFVHNFILHNKHKKKKQPTQQKQKPKTTQKKAHCW